MTNFFLLLIRIYSRLASPVLEHLFGRGCRFNPTCSQYSYDALTLFGLLHGGALSIKRFLRCNPFASGYYDPVPEKETL